MLESLELQCRRIFECTSDALVVFNQRGRVVEANPAACRMYGFSHDEFVGTHGEELMSPEGFAKLYSGAKRSRICQTEGAHKRKEASWIPAKATAISLQLAGTDALAMVVVDITGETKTLEALREREQRWRGVVQTTPECIKVIAPDGTVQQMNPAGLAMVEAESASSVVGRSVFDLIAPEYQEEFRRFNDYICLGQHGALRYDLIGLEGTRRHVETHAAPLSNPDGTIIHLAYTRDLTEQRQTEEALFESDARFRATFHQAAVGLVESDLAGRHRMVNDRYCDITGYSRQELLEKRFLDITHPDDVEQNREKFELLLTGSIETYDLEKRYLRKDGSIVWAQVTVSLIRDRAGEPWYTIAGVQDISERKRKEQVLGFLVALNAATQQLIEPEEITAVTARLLGEHLGVNRCAYAEVEDDQDHFTITGDYARGVDHLSGRFRMSGFGTEARRLMLADRPYVVTDAENDPRVRANLEAYVQMQIRAVICVPLQKAGRFVAGMAVHQQSARKWRSDEIELVEMVVGRCWESIERARTVRSLRESEQHLQFVLDSIPQKIFTAKPTGEVDYLNPQWRTFSGLTIEEVKAWRRISFVHPDDRKHSIFAWWRAIRSGQPMQLEHRFRSKRGRFRWHTTRAIPVRNAKGELVRWVGSSTDIHDVKAAEEAASRRSEQVRRLATVATRLTTAPGVDTIVEVVRSEARDLVGARRAAVLFTGAPLEPGSDKAPARVGDAPDDVLELADEVRACNRALKIGRKTLGRRRNGRRPTSGLLAAPLLERSGRNIGAIVLWDKRQEDFSDDDQGVLVQLAQMASVALEKGLVVEDLREASKRKDEFLAILAHELRNPLAPVRNMLEAMKRSGDRGPRATHAREIIEQQVGQMVRIIDDLLDVSRVSRGKFGLRRELVHLQPIIKRATQVCQTDGHPGHKLEVSTPPDPVYMKADPVRVLQILENLLDNACKYTSPGGRIWVAAECQNGQLVLRVGDTGIGIPPDQLTGIFNMFSRVDQSLENPWGGLGIGLTLTKHLVEMHGGTITASSPGIGEGSEFVVCLPIVAATSAAPEAPLNTVSANPASQRVLVVDDNKESADSLAMILDMSGHRTYTAYDGLEAVAAAEKVRPEVILLDLGLPKLNGYGVCRRIRQEEWGRAINIIAVSGWGQEKDRQESREAGFDAHLVKPVDFGVISKLLAEGRPR